MLWLTIILIPLVILVGCALFLGALALPIIGAVKASDGTYYRYPVVGIVPQPTLKTGVEMPGASCLIR